MTMSNSSDEISEIRRQCQLLLERVNDLDSKVQSQEHEVKQMKGLARQFVRVLKSVTDTVIK